MAHFDHGEAAHDKKVQENYEKLKEWMRAEARSKTKPLGTKHDANNFLAHQKDSSVPLIELPQEEPPKNLLDFNAIDITFALEGMLKVEAEKDENKKNVEEFQGFFKILDKFLPHHFSPSDIIG